MGVQGNSAPSLLQLTSKEEHTRVRKHLTAFFTPENVDSIASTLCAAVADKVHEIAAEARAAPGGMARVNATFAHALINDVVMKSRPSAACPQA
jgi:cytochrome P450